MGKLRKMRTLADDDDDEAAASNTSKAGASQQPAWMRSLLHHCQEWLAGLPGVNIRSFSSRSGAHFNQSQALKTLQKSSGDNQDPLFRFFAREGSVGRKLLVQVRRDLSDVIKVCEGSLKQTNHLRNLMSHLTKGVVARPLLRTWNNNSSDRYHP